MWKKEQYDYTVEDGGGDNWGLTPTDVVSWLFEEEMLAKLCTISFPCTVFTTCITCTSSEMSVNEWNILNLYGNVY